MSIDPKKIKELMGRLEVSFSKGISREDLEQKLGGTIDNELAYCKKKKWIEERQGLWYATSKGVDASIKMQKGKECFEVDP